VSAIDIDFLPPEWRARRAKRRSMLSRLGVTSILLVAIAAAQIWLVQRDIALADEMRSVDTEHARARSRIGEVEELDRRKGDLAQRLDLLKDVLKRARGAEIVAAIGRSAPDSVVLEFIDFHVNDELNGTPAIELNIRGTCTAHESAVHFADTLALEPAIASARLVSSQATAVAGTKEFVITGLAPGLLRTPPGIATIESGSAR